MSIKRIKCRDHGGIFTVQASRGRQPVRCKPEEYPCDRADSPSEVVAEAPKQVNPSLTLAKAAKARLEALGWVVKGKAKVDGERHGAEITCSRDMETLIMRWLDGELITQDYSLDPALMLAPLQGVPEDNRPADKLHFDPANLTDSELVKTIRGMPVRWWNTIAGSEERAVIGNKVTIEHVFRENGDEDEAKRIVKFIDHNGGGFRAFHVSALLKVG